MMFPSKLRNAPSSGRRPLLILGLCASAASILLAGCRHIDEGSRVAGWSLADPSQRHPIMVTQQPTTMSLRVARGSYGLSPHQRAQVVSFVERYAGVDASNSRLIVEVPSGSANEVAAMQAAAEIRSIITQSGFDAADVNIEAVQANGDAQAPIRLSYLRYVAEGPQCSRWGQNLSMTYDNTNFSNFGCATQANFAAMIANPSDLVTPRARTPRVGERENGYWDKYVTGQSTISAKSGDEKVSTGK